MGSLVIVVAYPVIDALTGIGKRCKHRLTQILTPERLPEPLNLTQSHRMVRSAAHVPNTLLLQHTLKTRLTTPCNKLPRIVREDLTGSAPLADGTLEYLEDRLCTLLPKQSPANDES
jgi:hypothetical protein